MRLRELGTVHFPLLPNGVQRIPPYPGLLILGSFYSLRLPILADSGDADFVPDHSCGRGAASPALPLGYVGDQFIGLGNVLL
jgi:hypothetical protein